MITANYENILALMLSIKGETNGLLGRARVINVAGNVRYLTGSSSSSIFPSTFNRTPTLNATLPGISIGTGSSPATKLDYNLENTITSGVSISVSDTILGSDSPGSPFITWLLTVTNTSANPITVREVGYKQVTAYTTRPLESTNSTQTLTCLLDRTVLETPITIQPGESGVIAYKFQALFTPPVKNGVSLVPFTYGSDEDVAAMIDAARQGLIDLQADGGWRPGDMRLIHMDSWTGGNNVSHEAQDILIMISHFGDYNSCGSLFQFDFAEVPTGNQRMNSTNTNVGSYASTEMYLTTLPAMVEALPTWLKSRLKTFDVLVSAGNRSSAIETVSNNKLALRSGAEVYESPSSYTYDGEGTLKQVYQSDIDKRQKWGGHLSVNKVNWWLRSPYRSATTSFAGFSSAGGMFNDNASKEYGVAPFGCI